MKQKFPQSIEELVKMVYENKLNSLENKIKILIRSRATAPIGSELEHACNKYLTLLYKEKYRNLIRNTNLKVCSINL